MDQDTPLSGTQRMVCNAWGVVYVVQMGCDWPFGAARRFVLLQQLQGVAIWLCGLDCTYCVTAGCAYGNTTATVHKPLQLAAATICRHAHPSTVFQVQGLWQRAPTVQVSVL